MDTLRRRERDELTVEQGIERLWSGDSLGFVDDAFASDFVLHEPTRPDDVRGSEGFKEYVRQIRAAFPDLVVDVLELDAEDDAVTVRYAWRGTQEGEFAGIEPTGTASEGSGTSFVRFEDGKYAEAWVVEDRR